MDSFRHQKKKIIFEKDLSSRYLGLFGKEEKEILSLISPTLPLMHALPDENEKVKEYRDELRKVGDSIEIVPMFNIPMDKTVQILKGSNEKEKQAIKAFVLSADLMLGDFFTKPCTFQLFLASKCADILPNSSNKNVTILFQRHWAEEAASPTRLIGISSSKSNILSTSIRSKI